MPRVVPRDIQERYEKLKKAIEHHRRLYHVEDREEISPEALDSLKYELVKIEEKYPTLITPDSTGAIQIKASGEATSLTDTAEEAFLSARREFEERYGYSLGDLDSDAKTIHYPFEVTEGLKNRVDFWVAVFGKYGRGKYI